MNFSLKRSHRTLKITKFLSFLDNKTTFTAFLTLIFFILGFIGILHHEIWRDEAQAWMIARDSISISNLVQNFQYESHPGLWYFCLYIITRFTHNPFAMQVFHLILATGVIFLFIKFSPFTKWQKILFTFSYFPFYQYSIISRNYNIGILLLFAFCSLFSTRKKTYIGLSIILALLAHTNIYGLILSLSLCLTLFVELILYRKNKDYVLSINKVDLVVSLCIFLVGVSSAIIELIPPEDGFQVVESSILNSSEDSGKITKLLLTISRAFLVLEIPQSIENNGLLSEIISVIFVLLSLGILTYIIILFCRRPIILFLYLSGTIGMSLFNYFMFLDGVRARHLGHFFILFLMCYWLSDAYPQIKFNYSFINRFSHWANKYIKHILILVFLLHLLAGSYYYLKDLMIPYSMSKKTSEFLINQQLVNLPIIGITASQVSPISAYINKKIYYIESGNLGSFVIFNDQKKNPYDIKIGEIWEQVEKFIQTRKHSKIVLISSFRLSFKTFPSYLENIPLANFRDSKVIENEKYEVYLIRKKKDSSLDNMPDNNV